MHTRISVIFLGQTQRPKEITECDNLILCVGSEDLVSLLFLILLSSNTKPRTHKPRESMALLTVASGWWIPQFRSVIRDSSYFDFQNLGPADLPHFIPCKIQAYGTQGDFTRPERHCLSFLEGSGGTDSLVESAKHFFVQEFEVGAWMISRNLFNIFPSWRNFCDTWELAWTREIRSRVTHALRLPCLQTISWC